MKNVLKKIRLNNQCMVLIKKITSIIDSDDGRIIQPSSLKYILGVNGYLLICQGHDKATAIITSICFGRTHYSAGVFNRNHNFIRTL